VVSAAWVAPVIAPGFAPVITPVIAPVIAPGKPGDRLEAKGAGSRT